MKIEWAIKPEDLIPMPSIMQQCTENAIKGVLSKQEQELREALSTHLPAGWTLDEIKNRCVLITVHGSPVQTLHLDGKPILEIHPIELGTPELRGDSYVQTITQKFRRL